MSSPSDTRKALARLIDAAEAYSADQTDVDDKRSGAVQPVTVAEAQELNDAIDNARLSLAAPEAPGLREALEKEAESHAFLHDFSHDEGLRQYHAEHCDALRAALASAPAPQAGYCERHPAVKIINHELICGAPQCCPVCCKEAEAEARAAPAAPVGTEGPGESGCYRCDTCGAVRSHTLIVPHSLSDYPMIMPRDLCNGKWLPHDRRSRERRRSDRRRAALASRPDVEARWSRELYERIKDTPEFKAEQAALFVEALRRAFVAGADRFYPTNPTPKSVIEEAKAEAAGERGFTGLGSTVPGPDRKEPSVRGIVHHSTGDQPEQGSGKQ